MAVAKNSFLVPTTGNTGRAVSPVLSERVLEGCRDSQAPQAGIIQKSCSDQLFACRTFHTNSCGNGKSSGLGFVA
jgi:hypothetical protein